MSGRSRHVTASGSGSIAAGGHITIRGATSEEVAALIEAATAPLAALNSAQQDRIEHLARESGLTAARFISLARRFVADVPDLDVAFAELARAVEVAIEVQDRGHAGSNADDFVAAVLARMAALSAEGRDGAAAAEADRAFAEWEQRQRLETQQGIALLEAGLRADILRRDAASAARRIAQRVELETPDPAKRFANLCADQHAWYVSGRDQGLNFDLEISIHLADVANSFAHSADERTAALDLFAISLATLGDRESGRERLHVAISALLAALEERTRDRMPLEWASTLMNLGNVLAAIGEREGGTERLEQAVVAIRASLRELTRDCVPQVWAMAQMNLGNVLWTLGERYSGTERLEQAVAAYRAALEERTRERAPIEWAMTQMNLGTALRTLGQREGGTERLQQAVAALRAALEVRTRERAPLDWATTQMNLGNALATLGTCEAGTERLNQAVVAFRDALTELTSERVPRDWAMAQMNLGNALRALGDREGSTQRLEQAISAYNSALEEWTTERAPLNWATGTANLAMAMALIADRSGQTRKAALAEIDAALEVFRTADAEADLRWAESIRARIAAGPAR